MDVEDLGEGLTAPVSSVPAFQVKGCKREAFYQYEFNMQNGHVRMISVSKLNGNIS